MSLEDDAEKRMAEVLNTKSDSPVSAANALESAMASAEDDMDVTATTTAKAEAAAELVEFDENVPLEDSNPSANDKEVSKAELELRSLMDQVI